MSNREWSEWQFIMTIYDKKDARLLKLMQDRLAACEIRKIVNPRNGLTEVEIRIRQ